MTVFSTLYCLQITECPPFPGMNIAKRPYNRQNIIP